MYRTLAMTFILSVAFVAGASAQIRYGEAEKNACRHDAVHLCKGMSEDYQVRDCLVAQKPRISHRCRVVLESHGY
jgi:hypothetical protein